VENSPAIVSVGGDPSLDLVNTVDWLEDGVENERLTDYGALTRWAEVAAILSPEQAEALRRRAATRPGEAAAAVGRARELRSVLQALFHGLARRGRAPASWDPLNRWLGEALEQLRVTPEAPPAGDGALARWTWLGASARLDWLLWPVAWSAARLLASPEADRIRVCAGPGCGWVYVDRSRNGLRRWCQMKTCGTAAKTRRRRRRRQTG